MNKIIVLSLALAAVGAAQAQVFANVDFDSMTVGAQIRTQAPFSTFGDTGMTVSNTLALSGTQSLATTGTTSVWNWVDIFPAYSGATDPNKILVSSMDFYMASGNVDTRIGLDAYTPAVARIAAVRANATNNRIELFANSNLVGATSTATFARNQWNNLRLTMDYNTNTVRAALNGVDLGMSVSLAAGAIADVDIWRSNSSTSMGTTYVDNYRVEAVPEPATMTALGLGVAALLRRRKKA